VDEQLLTGKVVVKTIKISVLRRADLLSSQIKLHSDFVDLGEDDFFRQLFVIESVGRKIET
jgi:hypothetical protein